MYPPTKIIYRISNSEYKRHNASLITLTTILKKYKYKLS